MTIETMLAFHGDPKIKTRYLNRVRRHAAADQIVRGSYWDGFRGCAVGCTIHGSDHGKYETELGIPRILAKLEDGIFESLPLERALTWPAEFLKAPAVGADLSMVWPRFAVWLLVDPEHGIVKYARNAKGEAAIRQVAELYQQVVDGGAVD